MRTFSIPNRIEPSATHANHRTPRGLAGLSVSPIGSSPLQHCPARDAVGAPETFSIPNRIEPSATWPEFEVLDTDENFQYPQSDRALCNCVTAPPPTCTCAAFSIPNRIEPSATRRSSSNTGDEPTFQYPQSDRALCNQSSADLSLARYGSFSIPNRIEPSATWLTHCSLRPISELSVSPIGSSPLQPSCIGTLLLSSLNFQYPQSDRALCNLKSLVVIV